MLTHMHTHTHTHTHAHTHTHIAHLHFKHKEVGQLETLWDTDRPHKRIRLETAARNAAIQIFSSPSITRYLALFLRVSPFLKLHCDFGSVRERVFCSIGTVPICAVRASASKLLFLTQTCFFLASFLFLSVSLCVSLSVLHVSLAHARSLLRMRSLTAHTHIHRCHCMCAHRLRHGSCRAKRCVHVCTCCVLCMCALCVRL